MTQKIKILVVEDKTIIRRAVCLLLKSNEMFDVIGEAENGLEAVNKAKELSPEVVVMEIDMPVMDGIKATREIKENNPGIKIIILTECSDKKLIMGSIKAGANCCVEKDSTESDLFAAISAAHKNKSYLSPSICKLAIESVRHDAHVDRFGLLTRGEQALLKSVAKGKSKKAIAEQISTTVEVINKHLKNVMIKLGIHDIDELVRYAINKGLVKGVAAEAASTEGDETDPKKTETEENDTLEPSEAVNKDGVSLRSIIDHGAGGGSKAEIKEPQASDISKAPKVLSSGQASDAPAIYSSAYDYLNDAIAIVKSGKSFDLNDGINIVNKMLEDSKTIDLLSGITFSVAKDKDSMILNMVNVAVYAIQIGMGLDFTKDKLVKTGLTGLLHDLGMFIVSESVTQKAGALNTEEKTEIEKHPVFSKRILSEFKNGYAWLAENVAQEHERMHGQGYPFGESGSGIKEYARIIGIADVFEALTHDRLGRRRLTAVKAARKIIVEEKDYYDAGLIKIVIEKLSCYPIGSYVMLNSNKIAKVVDINGKFPLQPIVEVFIKPQKDGILEKKIVDLRQNQSLHIVEPVLEENLAASSFVF